MRATLLFIFSLFLFYSCSEKQSGIEQFKWLEGKWEGHPDDSTTLFENWKFIDEGKVNGTGGMIIHNDTIFAEKMNIYQKEDHFYYHVEVPENETPVDFLFDNEQTDSAVFVNKEHDFPQRIVYYYKNKGKLNAYIDGVFKGIYRKETFDYEKK